MQIVVRFMVLLLLMFWTTKLCTGQSIQAELDQIVEPYYYDGPGYVIRIEKDGSRLYERAIGLADMDEEIPLMNDHIFRIGSITKQFTAVAILQLIDRGTICIEDPITSFIPDYPDPNSDITIEHLLTHTSGIKSYTEIDAWRMAKRSEPITVDDLISLFKDEAPDFLPGEEFRYNNSGYVLLGKIIEVVTGSSYANYMATSIFDVVGLSDTRIGDSDFLKPRRALGYRVDSLGTYRIDDDISMDYPYAAGAIISTAEDLSKWYHAVFAGELLSDEMLNQAHVPYQLNNGRYTNYGYGWYLNMVDGTEVIRHGGGINGFSTSSAFLPQEEIFITVLSNCINNPSDQLMKKLVMECLALNTAEVKRYSVQQSQLSQYVGSYTFPNGEECHIELVDGVLIGYGRYQARVQLHPIAEHTFKVVSHDYKVRFNINRSGETKSLSLYSDTEEVAIKQ